MGKEQSAHSDAVELIPIGGLGRIGLNVLAMRCGDTTVLLDCGVRFPDPSQPGAEVVLPDLEFIDTLAGELTAIVLTHGHEDHIGAVPHVLKRVKVPVYGTPFTLGLVHAKLVEHGMEREVDLRVIGPEFPLVLGELHFEFLRVTHSIPDCVSLVVRTPVGTIVHTGDWKIDREPVDGEAFDEAGFQRIGDEGVLLLLSDSTNAQVPGWCRSEREVGRGLQREIEGHPGRVVVVMFASNVHRMNLLAEIAQATNRKLCLLGRSLTRYQQIARDVGRSRIDPGSLIAPDRLANVPPENALVVVTGSQGEPRAVFSRAARGEHRHLKFGPGDKILFSARAIPGNEREIYTAVGQISRLGAQVVMPRDAPIHASGHARQEELLAMLEWTCPRFFVPVHGEHTFLVDHARLAADAGVERVEVIESGRVLRLSASGLELGKQMALRPYFYDGVVTGDEEEHRFRERMQVAYNGVAVARLTVKRGSGSLAVSASLQTHGLFTDRDRLLEEGGQQVGKDLSALPSFTPAADLDEACRMAVRRFFRKAIGRKPVVIIVREDLD